MSAGYVIAQLKITNPENYKEYVETVNRINYQPNYNYK